MNNFNSFIHSNMFYVNFAGFRASGIELQNKGWSFSLHQSFSHKSYGYDLQLMLKHGVSGIVMCSHFELLEMKKLMSEFRNGRDLPEFETMSVSMDGINSYIRIPKAFEVSFTNRNFFAIDATPRYEEIDLSKIDFNNFGVFKRLNDSANLFLPEKTINEILDDLLKKQKSNQDKIIKKRRTSDFMQEFNRNPNEDIKLQLVAI